MISWLWQAPAWGILTATGGGVAAVWLMGLARPGPGGQGGSWTIWPGTLGLTLAATAAALIAALPVAWVLAGAGRRMAALITLLGVSVLIMPPYIYAYAWDLVTSPQSTLGKRIYVTKDAAAWLTFGGIRAGWVLALWVWPVPALWLGHVFAGQGRWLIAHGLLDASRRQVLLRLLIPAYWPHVLGAAAVTAVLVLTEFSVPHLYGVPVVATDLLARWESAYPQPIESLARLSLPMGLIGVVGAVLVGRSMGRQAAPDSGVVATDSCPWARPGWLGWLLAGGVLGLSVVWPLAALVGGISPRIGRSDLAVYTEHIRTTPWVAGAAVVCCLYLAIGMSRSRRPVRYWAVLLLPMVAAALPAVMVGGALATAYQPAPRAITSSAWMVAAVCVARFGALMLVIVWAAVRGVPGELEEMAELDGAGPWRRWWQVVLPQVWRPAAAGCVLVFALAVGEVAGTGVTLPPGLKWFPQLLLNQMHYSRSDTVIVGCLLMMGLTWSLTAAVFLLSGLRRS